jgi:hypothetical protein
MYRWRQSAGFVRAPPPGANREQIMDLVDTIFRALRLGVLLLGTALSLVLALYCAVTSEWMGVAFGLATAAIIFLA